MSRLVFTEFESQVAPALFNTFRSFHFGSSTENDVSLGVSLPSWFNILSSNIDWMNETPPTVTRLGSRWFDNRIN